MSLAPCIGRPVAAHLFRPSQTPTDTQSTKATRPLLALNARGGSRQHLHSTSSSCRPIVMFRSLLLLTSSSSSSSSTAVSRFASAAATGTSSLESLVSSSSSWAWKQQRRGAWRAMASLRGTGAAAAAAGGDARQPLGEVTNQRSAAYSSGKPHAGGSKGVPLPPPRAASGAADATAAAATAATSRSAGSGGTPAKGPAPPAGAIELIVGPMFAGKTTRLLQRVAECEAQGLRVALVKSGKDTRYSASEVVSHDGARRVCHAVESLAAFHALAPRPWWYDVDVIAIDEAQFFPDLAEFARAAADRHGKRVIAAGLDGDYKRRRFGQVLDLVPAADSVVKLAARCAFCEDGAPALFSLRIVADERQEVVGGADKYAPVCRAHYVSLSSLREFSGAGSSVAGDDAGSTEGTGAEGGGGLEEEEEEEEAAAARGGQGGGCDENDDENDAAAAQLQQQQQQQHGHT